jgi:hypothetical protein
MPRSNSAKGQETSAARPASWCVLAPVYRWFTEGFGTRDLKERQFVEQRSTVGASKDCSMAHDAFSYFPLNQASSQPNCEDEASLCHGGPTSGAYATTPPRRSMQCVSSAQTFQPQGTIVAEV